MPDAICGSIAFLPDVLSSRFSPRRSWRRRLLRLLLALATLWKELSVEALRSVLPFAVFWSDEAVCWLSMEVFRASLATDGTLPGASETSPTDTFRLGLCLEWMPAMESSKRAARLLTTELLRSDSSQGVPFVVPLFFEKLSSQALAPAVSRCDESVMDGSCGHCLRKIRVPAVNRCHVRFFGDVSWNQTGAAAIAN